MKKEASSRTVSDVKDLSLIIQKLDFIKNSDLLEQDYFEIAKGANLIALDPLKRLCKEGSESNCLYFVIQG